MSFYSELKKIWKKLNINGQVKNFSSKTLWALETDSGKPIAHLLPPMTMSPRQIDVDAFKRRDGVAIEGHKNWWKFYDFSTVDVHDIGDDLKISVATKSAVSETKFGNAKYNDANNWGVPIRLITEMRKEKGKTKYQVTGLGWVEKKDAFEMTCFGEIANARPVFPANSEPYIRTKRDGSLQNNLLKK